MTHLPYIAASYGLAALVLLGFAANSWRRMRLARRRLEAIDTRRAARQATGEAGENT